MKDRALDAQVQLKRRIWGTQIRDDVITCTAGMTLTSTNESSYLPDLGEVVGLCPLSNRRCTAGDKGQEINSDCGAFIHKIDNRRYHTLFRSSWVLSTSRPIRYGRAIYHSLLRSDQRN